MTRHELRLRPGLFARWQKCAKKGRRNTADWARLVLEEAPLDKLPDDPGSGDWRWALSLDRKLTRHVQRGARKRGISVSAWIRAVLDAAVEQ